MHRFYALLLIFFSALAPGNAQEEKIQLKMSGYVSSLQSFIFEDLQEDWINDNLIHNRLNFRVYAGSNLTFAMDLRNRFLTGDMIRGNPQYAAMLAGDKGVIDLTSNVFSENSFILNARIDRLWADLSMGPVQIRAGRQRINWGQTLIWNPNDIFNAYSYFDVDYPERPGSDAVRLQVYPGFSSSLELAVAMDSDRDLTLAGMYRFNKWGYDIQCLAGMVNSEDIVFGTGWSGALGATSFRGEISWFQPEKNFTDTAGTGLFTIGFDRALKGNGMLQIQLMYCNKPLTLTSFDDFYSDNMSAKDLALSEFSLFAAVNYPVSPLFNMGMAAIWYPGLKGFFAGPSAEISLAGNLDFSFIWQYFNAEMDQERTSINLAFIRMKYSF